MGKKLLVVEDCFVARGPGVLVAPRFTAAEAPTPGDGASFAVRLVLPDGSSREAKATVDVAHLRGALPPWSMLRLHGVAVDDVPPGTEIWSTP